MIRVFIGVDRRQPVAYNIAAMSAALRSSHPIAITPLILSQLPITRRGLTDFTYSRLLVPWLCDYAGRAVYVDGDVLVRADLAAIFNGLDDSPVHVVDHPERRYERSSVMVFDCPQCKVLTPTYIEKFPNPLSLDWAGKVGELDPAWNHLVGYDPPNPDAKIVHFTQGIPCFPETQDAEHGAEWREMAKTAMSTVSWASMMGSSVHAASVLKQQRENHASV